MPLMFVRLLWLEIVAAYNAGEKPRDVQVFDDHCRSRSGHASDFRWVAYLGSFDEGLRRRFLGLTGTAEQIGKRLVILGRFTQKSYPRLAATPWITSASFYLIDTQGQVALSCLSSKQGPEANPPRHQNAS